LILKLERSENSSFSSKLYRNVSRKSKKLGTLWGRKSLRNTDNNPRFIINQCYERYVSYNISEKQ